MCVWDHVARTVAWLDAANGRGPQETAARILKITEEAGEATAAYLGLTGANPRKGVTATPDELAGELCDVVLAALIALATISGGTPHAESRLARHVAARAIRLRGPARRRITVPGRAPAGPAHPQPENRRPTPPCPAETPPSRSPGT